MSKPVAVSVTIVGKVQGVWYRAWTKEQADRLALRGYVKNLANGNVKAVFVGETADVDTMVRLCWEGPEYAQVTDVVTEVCEDGNEFVDFVIER